MEAISHEIGNKFSKTMSDGSDLHDIGNKVSKQCQMEAIHTTLGGKKKCGQEAWPRLWEAWPYPPCCDGWAFQSWSKKH